MAVKGKVCYFSRNDIKKLEPNVKFREDDYKLLYDILEEHMLELGFVMYDGDIVFDKEIVVNGYHEIRYNCMVIKGHRRKNKFIISDVGIQYRHIK